MLEPGNGRPTFFSVPSLQLADFFAQFSRERVQSPDFLPDSISVDIQEFGTKSTA